jgi:uncharacterized membrane protein
VPEQTIQLVNPNLHAMMIHFPIALLFVGTIIELLSFMWRRSGFRAAGRWMILIGALSSIPAATTGMFAARQAMDVSPDEKLVDLKKEAPLDAEQWDHLRHHIKFNGSAAALLGLLVVGWLGASDHVRQRGHIAYVIALLIAVGLITCGAWHGGEMVYTHRTGTGLVRGGWPKSPEKPAMAPKPVNDETGGGKWAFDALRSTEEQIRKVDDTTDFHIQFAGWTAALALVTLGLSIRALWLRPSVAGEEDLPGNDDDIAFAIAGHEKRAQTGAPPESVRVEAPARVPAARFWLLACLLGIVTALLGWMLVAPGSMAEATKLLKDYPRYMAHSIAGGSIVVLMLILALVTRFAPHNRVLVGCFSLLLVTALAVQVWLGILLLFDTNEGPINHFNAATTQGSLI